MPSTTAFFTNRKNVVPCIILILLHGALSCILPDKEVAHAELGIMGAHYTAARLLIMILGLLPVQLVIRDWPRSGARKPPASHAILASYIQLVLFRALTGVQRS